MRTVDLLVVESTEPVLATGAPTCFTGFALKADNSFAELPPVFPDGALEPVVPAGVESLVEEDEDEEFPEPAPELAEVPEPDDPEPDDGELEAEAVVTVADDAAGQLSRRSEESWVSACASAFSSELTAALAPSRVAALSGPASAFALERAFSSAASLALSVRTLAWSESTVEAATPLGTETVTLPPYPKVALTCVCDESAWRVTVATEVG
jgi:hypothetical protein